MSSKRQRSSEHDIQPLRDLARNFDIDIEPYLQEYLNDDDGHNDEEAKRFASAALKLQNSTSIYTRKVDFLHRVVYEAHEALHEFVSGGKQPRRRKGHLDDDIDEFRRYDDHMEFLLLHDVLPVDAADGRKIDLPCRRNADVVGPTSDVNVTLLSLGGIVSATRDDSLRISRQADASPAAASRMLSQNLNSDTAEWRLVGTDVDEMGALVLPGAKKGVFVNGDWMRPESRQSVEGHVQVVPGEWSLGNSRCEDLEHQDVEFGGDDGLGFEVHTINHDADDMPAEPHMEPPHVPQVVKKERKKKDDPWATLDPHQPSNDKPRPIKIGVTFSLPMGLEEEDRPSACVTGSRTRNVKSIQSNVQEKDDRYRWNESPFATDWLDPIHHDSAHETDGTSLCNLKAMIYGDEFAYIANKWTTHYCALEKQTRHQQEGNDQVVGDSVMFDDDYGSGGFDYDEDDDRHSYDHHPLENEVTRSNVDFAAIDDVFASAGFHDSGEDYNHSQLSFEELCRAHLRKFSKSAEIYAAETQLTKRVGAWQSGLAPMLDEQEKRPEFDIHSMGRQILQSVEEKLSTRKRGATGHKKLDATPIITSDGVNNGNVVGFQQISKDYEEYEVCRLFLSTLMLCNSGNVKVHDGYDVYSTNSLEIELLNSKFEAVMEEFLVPSIENRE